jgi:hypothetical protein
VQAALHDLFTTLAFTPGASLYHCSAGKDRTGWASAVLLTLLGVSSDVVMQDYLLSNTYYFNSPSVQNTLAALPPATTAIYTHLLDVEPAYLQAGLDQVKATYGSMTNYALRGLKLSPVTLALLRAKPWMTKRWPPSSQHKGISPYYVRDMDRRCSDWRLVRSSRLVEKPSHHADARLQELSRFPEDLGASLP